MLGENYVKGGCSDQVSLECAFGVRRNTALGINTSIQSKIQTNVNRGQHPERLRRHQKDYEECLITTSRS